AGIPRSWVLAVTDEHFVVVSASGDGSDFLTNRPLDNLIAGAQPLFMFGDRAGVLNVRMNNTDWLAAVDIVPGRTGASVVLVPVESVFLEWRRSVSLNVTLFVLMAGVLMAILYAYFSQAARAEAADRIYVEAHQRIDLALLRGKSGLWDWDLARGKMYWSRSMFEILGYEPTDAMLSFGEVAGIIHPEDADLFAVANRIVS